VITTKIKAAMAKDKQVSAMHIKVDTDNKGVVTLSGKAKSQAEADKAVSIARNTEGVVDVRSDIQVVADR
jgi:osmotically-inducible protein OsmY